MAASSSAAAADSRPPKYDVFISFRGEDTGKGFTSHLYSALSGKQIKVYIDEVSLEKGDTVSRALPEAIKESEISIIIFSENYGESRWCLDELVHILKRREEKDQIVLPIFYNIDPSHIRNQETYAAFFVKHEERFKDEMEKVREWRRVLTEAAGLSGLDSQNLSESEILEEVVERVRTELDTLMSKRSDDLKGLVGVPERLEKIKSFLDSPTVRVVGIGGMAGIGKTTLARLVFKRFYNDFEGSCFSPSVRENAIKKGLDTLEREVFSELNVNDGLSCKRILLVLDDVDNFDQLKRLAGDRDRFGPGSKIILTSRDLQALIQLIDVRYEVQALDLNEASQLFYLKAFEENSCRTGYEEKSAEVVSFTGGNPLALQVLGSSLKSLGVIQWESALEKLKRTPHVDIQKVLRISYDGLDTREQDTFLDIACFLKNETENFVEGVLEHKSIKGLVHKSLITIDQDGLIRMHDLLQEMGWEIVRQSTKKLGERSRLWTAEDVSNVLENNKGTEAIEGIYLPWIKEVHLRPDVFEKMRKLRLLKIYNAHQFNRDSEVKVYVDGDLKYLPNGLRYLHWEGYLGKSWPSNFQPENLVELHMPCSELEQLWDGVLELGSLKHINLHYSWRLTKIPDLSLASKLESIDLSDCWRLTSLPEVSGNIRKLVLSGTGLEELPSSIESLANLLLLNLSGCYKLKSLPKLPRNIELLSLSNCSVLGSLPMLSGLCSLTKLDLSNCEIREIPDWLGSLTSLTKLDLRGNYFGRIPESIGKLYNLKKLLMDACLNLESLPESIGMLYNLKELRIRGFELQTLPASIGKLYNLKKLVLDACLKLQTLPESIGKLYNLKELHISGSKLQTLPASIGMLYKLKKLDISDNYNLESLPESIGMLYNLKELCISHCYNLQSLPELPLLINYVFAEGCSSLEMVSTLRSTLTLGRWLDKYDSDNYCHRREFSFVNCRNLGEDAINNIFREFLYKVFCTATTPPEVVVSNAERVIRELVVCYPTKEIPRWFKNHSEGSSITSTTIALPPHWYNPKTFLGFVVFAVVKDKAKAEAEAEAEALAEARARALSKFVARAKIEAEDETLANVIVLAKFEAEARAHFEAKARAKFEAEAEARAEARAEAEGSTSVAGPSSVEGILHLRTNIDRFSFIQSTMDNRLDHIIMWYNYFDYSMANFKECKMASFEFKSRFVNVTRCGVRMLCLGDAVEKFDDSTTANFESWRTDVMDSDDKDQSCGSDDEYQSCGSDYDYQ